MISMVLCNHFATFTTRFHPLGLQQRTAPLSTLATLVCRYAEEAEADDAADVDMPEDQHGMGTMMQEPDEEEEEVRMLDVGLSNRISYSQNFQKAPEGLPKLPLI